MYDGYGCGTGKVRRAGGLSDENYLPSAGISLLSGEEGNDRESMKAIGQKDQQVNGSSRVGPSRNATGMFPTIFLISSLSSYAIPLAHIGFKQ